tara:strand:- start:66 stop:1451 length:1386 start_codon:yes stop_codon:yes gene_type:complete
MAILYSYPNISQIASNDLMIITDVSDDNKTCSVKISELGSYFNNLIIGNLTNGYIPVQEAGKLEDSILRYDAGSSQIVCNDAATGVGFIKASGFESDIGATNVAFSLGGGDIDNPTNWTEDAGSQNAGGWNPFAKNRSVVGGVGDLYQSFAGGTNLNTYANNYRGSVNLLSDKQNYFIGDNSYAGQSPGVVALVNDSRIQTGASSGPATTSLALYNTNWSTSSTGFVAFLGRVNQRANGAFSTGGGFYRGMFGVKGNGDIITGGFTTINNGDSASIQERYSLPNSRLYAGNITVGLYKDLTSNNPPPSITEGPIQLDGNAGRVKLLFASDATRGLGIYQSDLSGVATGVVNFHYQGTGGGSRFVISRGNTGGAEIELENNGNIEFNRTGNGNVSIGNTSGSTIFTARGPAVLDDKVTLNGLDSYDDDVAAGNDGLQTGDLYQTNGNGAAPLNVAGIVMIKQ